MEPVITVEVILQLLLFPKYIICASYWHLFSNVHVWVTCAPGTELPPLFFSNFLFAYLFSIRLLFFFIISALFSYFNFYIKQSGYMYKKKLLYKTIGLYVQKNLLYKTIGLYVQKKLLYKTIELYVQKKTSI